MQYSSGPNPFEVANRFIGNLYSKGTRSRRDQEQHSLTQQTLALHAAQYGATMEQANQQHKLTQRAERGKTKRATSFATTIHGFAQPGAQVSIKHGDISASYTAKNPVTPTVQKLGRVPVKKNRGGKRPQ
jgi:hypothetical protein